MEKTEKIKAVIEKVAKRQKDEEENNNQSDKTQVVVFSVDEEEYAVPITDLKEIIRIGERITPVPNSPDFITGILNLRGKIVIVLDLEKRFNLQRTSEQKAEHILITEIGDNLFGLIVDNVTEILSVPTELIKKTANPFLEKIKEENIKGVIVMGEEGEKNGRIIVVLDIFKILSAKELSELGKTKTEIEDEKTA